MNPGLVVLAMALGVEIGCSAGAHVFGEPMHAVDDLMTDDVQGVARRHRYLGLDAVIAAVRADPRPRVRANAVTVILDAMYFNGRLDDARGYLLDALSDPSPDVEARAADGLAGWFLEDASVKTALRQHVASLGEAATNPDPIVQAHAISALEKMGERPPPAAILAASNSAIRRRGIEQAMVARDASAVPLLIRLAHDDPEVVVRLEAIPVVAALASPDVRDAFLLTFIDGEENHLANEAIKAAGDTRATALVERLRAIVARHEAQRTGSAIAALAALRDTSSVPLIAALISDRSTDIRWNSKLALDVLVGPERGLLEWQAWAQQQGYLHP